MLAAGCGKESDPAAGSAATDAAPAAAPEPTVDIPDTGVAAIALAKWTGDLDGMIERRLIRVLTTYSKTSYFIDQGTPRGLVPETFKLFEDDLNKRLKNKHVRVQVVIVPVAHDELVPALLEGRGDIVAAGKLISAWRKEQVDFTNPTRSGISVIAVSGPGVPPINSVQDLAGREIYLRPSDAPKAAVDRFNADLAKAGKPPVRIRPAPEVLADEDMIEMVSAGLVPVTLVEDHIAEFWQQVFPNIVLNTAAAVRTDGETGMMVRKGSPKLLEELNAFLARYPQGSLTRNVLLAEVPQEHQVREAGHCGRRHEALARRRRADAQVRRPVRHGLPAHGRAGIPGVRAGPRAQEPCRRDRRHAGDAGRPAPNRRWATSGSSSPTSMRA